jgi:hypothetical protein
MRVSRLAVNRWSRSPAPAYAPRAVSAGKRLAGRERRKGLHLASGGGALDALLAGCGVAERKADGVVVDQPEGQGGLAGGQASGNHAEAGGEGAHAQGRCAAGADDREGLGHDAVAGEHPPPVLLTLRRAEPQGQVPASSPAACRWLAMPASVDRG